MTLDPQQLEFLLYLVGALAIGFLFGFILSRTLDKEKYTPEIESLMDIIDTKDSEIEVASAKHGQLKQHMAVQSSELDSYKQQLIDMQRALTDQKKSIASFADEKSKYEEIIKQNEAQNGAYQARIEELVLSNESVSKMLEEQKEGAGALKEKLVESQEALGKNVKINHEFAMQLENFEKEIKTLQAQKEGLISKIESLETSIGEKEQQIAVLEQQAEEATNASQKNQELLKRVDTITMAFEENKNKLNELTAKQAVTTQLESENESLQQRLHETKELLREKESLLENMKEEESQKIEATSVKLQTLQSEIEVLNQALNAKEEALGAANLEIEHIKNSQASNGIEENASIEAMERDENHENSRWGFVDFGLVKKAKDKLSSFGDKNNTPVVEKDSMTTAKLKLYKEDVLKHYGSLDNNLLEAVVKGLGPSIFNPNSELVACSKSDELLSVRTQFLRNKLALTQSDEVLDSAIAEVCQMMKGTNRKYRATFYYILVKKFQKEGLYLS